MNAIFMWLLMVLSWLLVPVGLFCLVDDQVLRPRRQLAARNANAVVPATSLLAYSLLPILLGILLLRLILGGLTTEVSALAIFLTCALVWGLDVALLRTRRQKAAQAAGVDLSVVPEPQSVGYARGFFAISLCTVLAQNYLSLPMVVSSDSMTPNLLRGDIILVDKNNYAVRTPAFGFKILKRGTPQRGDVVVVRNRSQPSQPRFERVVGLPGDTVEVGDDRLLINGQAVPTKTGAPYNDPCYTNMPHAQVQLGGRWHDILFCSKSLGARLPVNENACYREGSWIYSCIEGDLATDSLPGWPSAADADPKDIQERTAWRAKVPPGHYFTLADDRNNNDDSRWEGAVPEDDLVGKVSRILWRPRAPNSPDSLWTHWNLQIP